MEQTIFFIGVFLDFSKAFDTVHHIILLQKLEFYGIRDVANDWVRNYLNNRQKYVTFNEVESNKQFVKCGVPQGSILGPLSFLIYINDIATISEHLYSIIFADDSNVFISGNELNSMCDLINLELAQLAAWLKANKLSLNIKKLTL